MKGSGKPLLFGKAARGCLRINYSGMKISEIPWEMVRMVSIDELSVRVTTEIGMFSYHFDTADELSTALLLLSLQGTKKVEYIDEARFNPARFMKGYAADAFSVLTT